MYISDELRLELDYFKRLNEDYEINLGAQGIKQIRELTDEIAYITLSASLAMDVYEEALFENLTITDKAITGKDEIQLDAYAIIETDETHRRELHLFQFKLYQSANKGASPLDVRRFADLMNDLFVHPEYREGKQETEWPVFQEIDSKIQSIVKGRKKTSVAVKCHFITNAYGINPNKEQDFQPVFNRYLTDKQERGFEISVYGVNEVIELAKFGKRSIKKQIIEIDLAHKQPYRLEDNSKSEGLGLPQKVLIGVCNVNQFIQLQNIYHHNQLYNENIRLYLGDRTKVNADIIHTVTSEESQWFLYMNNGISIICDDLQYINVDKDKNVERWELSNMQIINGCQTINALYSAKYNSKTRDNFRPYNVLVKIYQSKEERFKQKVIKATNNQTAVKSYSLVANDSIQIEIQTALKSINIIYDRKGEARNEKDKTTLSLVQGALAFRAVYWYQAGFLRTKIWKTRLFEGKEYEKIFNPAISLSENKNELYTLAVKLAVADFIVKFFRILIHDKGDKLKKELPFIHQSVYYLAGIYYAKKNHEINLLIQKLIDLIVEDNPIKSKSILSSELLKLETSINETWEEVVEVLLKFFNSLYKGDGVIDTLIKSNRFAQGFVDVLKEINPLSLNEWEENE